MDVSSLICDRARSIDVSGIRRVFELGASLKNPINLSIGQPDFPVPDAMKDAAIEAIRGDRNGYTVTQGAPALRGRAARHLAEDVGWRVPGDDAGLLITSGTSGALLLAALALLEPGDEIVVPDPYFVIYPKLATIAGARAVFCDTYPDFRMTAERVEPLITERTKIVLANTPSNPVGAVLTSRQCRELLELCRSRNVLLISDEIYDEFTFDDAREPAGDGGAPKCPSPARDPGAETDMLLVRGFGKTYGCTGWRMGYAAGPAPIISEMAKFQQYTFVCAPSIAQWGCVPALDIDMSERIEAYRRRRDMVMDRLGGVARIEKPGGAFYAFVEIPDRLGLTGTQFVERAVERNVLVIPGGVFSESDTHFRLSFATDEAKLEQGLDILAELLSG